MLLCDYLPVIFQKKKKERKSTLTIRINEYSNEYGELIRKRMFQYQSKVILKAINKTRKNNLIILIKEYSQFNMQFSEKNFHLNTKALTSFRVFHGANVPNLTIR